jgi:excisionase family DNA binding protein
MDAPDVLTPEEAADLLRVTVDTVRKLLREGKLPGAKVGREWRLLRRDLEAHLRGEGRTEG